MSITEDAPVQVSSPQRPETTVTVTWWWLVTASLVVLTLAGGTLAIWWAFSRETRTTPYRVLGDLTGVRIDVGDADVEIDGGATALEVRRVDRFAFGRPPRESRKVENGTIAIRSRCPDQVLGSCRTSYHLSVPDNIPIEVETTSGTVHLAGVRASVQVTTGSGNVAATGFCGFSFSAGSDSGHLAVVSACSADRLELRSRTGDIHVTVPAGRYEVTARSDTGEARTHGLIPVEDGGFEILAQSTDGDVTVEAAS